MLHAEPVRIGEVEFFVEVDGVGPKQVRTQRTHSFDAVRETMHAVASEFARVWAQVRPDEATVEFGLSATARSGRLTGLLVDGGGDAAFKVTMTWRHPRPAGAEEPAAAEPAPIAPAAAADTDERGQTVRS